MTPEEEARFREICDEPVLVCPRCNAGHMEELDGALVCVTCELRAYLQGEALVWH